MEDNWNAEDTKKQVAFFLNQELFDIVDPIQLNKFIMDCDTDLSMAFELINKYKYHKCSIEPFNDVDWNRVGNYKFDGKLIRKIIKHISLFEHLGFSEPFENQSNIIINDLLGISRTNFDEITNVLMNEGFVKQQGSFIWAVMYLEEFITEWLLELKPDYLIKFLEILQNGKLSSAFSKQLLNLSKTIPIDRFVALFTSESLLLKSFETVNTETVSNLIYHLAEIAPAQICEALYELFLPLSTEKIFELRNGRRNIIWALEKLAFRQDTFSKSAELLAMFALAENEDISNNATFQFIHLFQPVLGSTEASLDERMNLLKQLISRYENNELFISCLGKCLQAGDFIRIGTPDKQVGVESKDFMPNSEEIHNYWYEAIQLLKTIAISDNPLHQKAEDIIIYYFPQQFNRGLNRNILPAIIEIIKKRENINKDLRQSFAYVLTDSLNIDEESKRLINDILEKYSGVTIKDKLVNLIQLPAYEAVREAEGYRDIAAEKAREFARQLSEFNTNNWFVDSIVLFSMEQRQTYAFANELGKFWTDPSELVELAVLKMKAIPFPEQNSSFIEGLITGVDNDNFTRGVIERFLAFPELQYHCIRFTRYLTLELADLNKLKFIAESNPKFIIPFQNIDLSNLKLEYIEVFLTWMKSIGEWGVWLAIDRLHAIVIKKVYSYKDLLSILKGIIFTKGMLKTKSPLSFSMMQYNYFVLRLLNDQDSNEYAIFFSNELIDACNDTNSFYDTSLKNLIFNLLDKNIANSWPVIGKALLDNQSPGWYSLQSLLEGYRFPDFDILLDWAQQHVNDGPIALMRFIPFETVTQTGTPIFSEIVLQMIDIFGENKLFLDELSARMHSYSTSGSALPIFESRKAMIQTLLNHNLSEVEEFAKVEIVKFDREIERENKFLDNYNLGHI